MPLDLARLVNVQRHGADMKAQCPACAEGGADLVGRDHLKVYADGRYGCAVNRTGEHYSRIYALAGVNSTGEAAYQPPPEEPLELPATWPLSILDRLIKDPSYWEGRGISAATLEPFRGGVATAGQLANRYVFPVFNDRDEIIGFDGRWVLKTPPPPPPGKTKGKTWKILGESRSFLWGGLDDINERVVLVESIGDSLKLREHGVPETVCLFGTHMSETILGFLVGRNPRQIIISTNLDDEKAMGGRVGRPGQEAAARIAKTLSTFFDEGVVSIMHPTEGVKDWGVASREQIRVAFGLDTDTKTEILSP